MIRKQIILLLVLGCSVSVSAQKASPDFESKYNAAKLLLTQDKNGLAMQSFNTLLQSNEKNDLLPYAQFYLANATYYDGDVSRAKEVFLQLTVKHPNWSKIEAAYLWLSRIGFEKSGLFNGMLYADKIESEPYLAKSNLYLKKEFAGKPLEVLEELYEEYPNNEELAMAYAKELSILPTSFETSLILDSLIQAFDFDRNQFSSIPESELKESYSIGILLPLFIDRLEATGVYLNKSLAVDIYEGAKMAVFDTDSTMFTLEVFDTKKILPN